MYVRVSLRGMLRLIRVDTLQCWFSSVMAHIKINRVESIYICCLPIDSNKQVHVYKLKI